MMKYNPSLQAHLCQKDWEFSVYVNEVMANLLLIFPWHVATIILKNTSTKQDFQRCGLPFCGFGLVASGSAGYFN